MQPFEDLKKRIENLETLSHLIRKMIKKIK